MPNPQDIVLSGTIGLASKRPTFAHERFGDPGTNVWRPYTNQAEIESLYSASQRSNKAFLTVNGWGDYNDGGTVFSIRTNSDSFSALTDGPTITWDASSGLKKTVTIAGNRTLSIVNSKNGDTGILYVKQDNVGGRTLTLPTNSLTPSGWALSTGANQLTVIGYSFDGTNYAWSKENYGVVTGGGGGGDITPPQLSSATATSATNIRLVFNEAVTATLPGWSFNNPAIVTPSAITQINSTTYDFTVTGLASIQTITYNYNSATGNTLDAAGNELVSGSGSVTNSIGALSYLTWDNLAASRNTQFNLNKGIKWDGVAAGNPQVFANQTLSDGKEVVCKVPDVANESWVFGLHNNTTSDWLSTWLYACRLNLTYFEQEGISGPIDTSVTAVVGDLLKIKYAGTTITLERSTNSGTSWTVIGTMATSASGVYNIGFRSMFGGPNEIYIQ